MLRPVSHDSLFTVAPRKSPGNLFGRQLSSAPANYRFFFVLLSFFILAEAGGFDSLPKALPPLNSGYAQSAAARSAPESESILEARGPVQDAESVSETLYVAAPAEPGEARAELPLGEEPASLDFLTTARSTDLFTTTNTAPSLDELFSSEFGRNKPEEENIHSYSNGAATLNRTMLPGRSDDGDESPYSDAQGFADSPAGASQDNGEVTPSHSEDVSSAFSDGWRLPAPTLPHHSAVPGQESPSKSTSAEGELLTDPHLLPAVTRSESQSYTAPSGVDAAAGATEEGPVLQTPAQAARQAQFVAPTESQRTPSHSEDVPSAFSDSWRVTAPTSPHQGGVREQESLSKSRFVEGELLTFPHLLRAVRRSGSQSPFQQHTGVAPTAGAVEVSEEAVLQTDAQAARQAQSTPSTESQSTVVRENAGSAVQGTLFEHSGAQDLEPARALDDEITGPAKEGGLSETPSLRSKQRSPSSLRPVPSRDHLKGRRSAPVKAPKQHKKLWRLLTALAVLALSAGGAYYYSKGSRKADEQ
ncbi:hypothetical protein CSUI_001969 [Cystoisospora suis]|uniref:Uncharacterized protein n=1 Tax=Cystoisospora suis TaxID=483139 RepID=A0A2C6LAS0_9APIC|nr:hypothetical protein CSUI_001969 [Cystoisospora suis]